MRYLRMEPIVMKRTLSIVAGLALGMFAITITPHHSQAQTTTGVTSTDPTDPPVCAPGTVCTR